MGISLPVIGVPGLLDGGANAYALLRDYIDLYGGCMPALQETSGSVAAVYNTALATGRNVVINGDFASDTIWSKGTGWTIAAGVASCDGSQVANTSLTQADLIPAGKDYEATFTVSNYSAGSVRIVLGNVEGTFRSANGTYVQAITSINAGNLKIEGNATFVGDIDNVTVTQTGILASSAYPGAEELDESGDGTADKDNWTVVNSALLTNPTTNELRIAHDGASNPGASQTSLTIGKRYLLATQAKTDGNATLRITEIGGSILYDETGSTSYQAIEFEFVATATTILLQSRTTTLGQYTQWRNLSVTEANPLNADTTGATVGQPGPAGLKAYSFDGTNDYVDWYSAELNSMFDPTKGTLLCFAKVSGGGVWTDGSHKALLTLQANTSNRIYIRRTNINNQLAIDYGAGGIAEVVNVSSSTTNWFMVAMTWQSPGNMVAYFNGAQSGTPQAIAGAWVENLISTATAIGALSTIPVQVWDGLLTLPALITDVLSADEHKALAKAAGVYS